MDGIDEGGSGGTAVEEAAAVQEGVVEAVKLSQWGFPKLAAASVGRRSEPSPHARRLAC